MKNTNNKLLENSREKIDILLSFGASEELDTSLDKLITFQIAKYNNNINQIRYELERFETKYQMDSEEFFSKFEAGTLGDDADCFEWVGLYENVLLYKQRIESLESALKK
jgi:hypothetical protein